jgi:putative ABC transport system ATP-binding protein
MAAPLIHARDLVKVYRVGDNEIRALAGVSVDIAQGEFVAVMGPSGSGKSTFMNIVGLLDTPTAGAYRLNGQDVAGLSTDELAHVRNKVFGFVFQGFNLLKRITAGENVALPMIYSGTPGAERRRRAQEQLANVGLAPYYDTLPNRLSGGQQQRVAIARALTNRPQLILADEPTGNLDRHTGQEVLSVLERVHHNGGTVVIVTHDPEIGARSHRRLRMLDGAIVSDEKS